jgi:hypothetical protein
MTVLASAGNTCCHDRRIKAAVVLAGRETPFGREVLEPDHDADPAGAR